MNAILKSYWLIRHGFCIDPRKPEWLTLFLFEVSVQLLAGLSPQMSEVAQPGAGPDKIYQMPTRVLELHKFLEVVNVQKMKTLSKLT